MSADELWQPIPNHLGYEVSNQGRVRSVQRELVDSLGRRYSKPGRLLSLGVGTHGYVQVQLGKKKYNTVHRLVLLAFVGRCPDGHEACHGDGNKLNNQLSNLRWDTPNANSSDLIAHGRHAMRRRQRCPRMHQLIEPNLVPWEARRGWRSCLSCSRADRNFRDRGLPSVPASQEFKELADVYYSRLGIGIGCDEATP